jgi:hypothetical protein
MADSPLLSAPLTAQEKPILDRLLQIRDKLLLLKQDKSTYVKSADVLPLYEEVINQGKYCETLPSAPNTDWQSAFIE